MGDVVLFLRFARPKHLVLGFAVSIAVASTTPARAQLDPNIQTRIETITPTIPTVSPTPPVEIKRVIVDLRTHQEISLQELKGRLKVFRRATLLNNKLQNLVADLPANLQALRENQLPALQAALLAVNAAVQTKAVAQTKLSVIVPFTPTLESNALKSNQNIQPDESFGIGGGFKLTTPGEFNTQDLVTVSGQTASSRYARNSSVSFDSVTVQGSYQLFLDNFDTSGVTVTRSGGAPRPRDTSPLTLTSDLLLFSLSNQTGFTPTFHRETADFLTPGVTLTRANIPLFGDTGKTCTVLTPNSAQPGQTPHGMHDIGAFCNFATVAISVANSFSDQAALANANATLAGAFGWNIKDNLQLALASSVQEKLYEQVVGGRQDIILKVGPTLQYTLNEYAVASLAINYVQQHSSISQDSWNGVVVLPTFTVNFPADSWAVSSTPH